MQVSSSLEIQFFANSYANKLPWIILEWEGITHVLKACYLCANYAKRKIWHEYYFQTKMKLKHMKQSKRKGIFKCHKRNTWENAGSSKGKNILNCSHTSWEQEPFKKTVNENAQADADYLVDIFV